jgi:hypothetical protein
MKRFLTWIGVVGLYAAIVVFQFILNGRSYSMLFVAMVAVPVTTEVICRLQREQGPLTSLWKTLFPPPVDPAKVLLDKVREQWIGQYLNPTLTSSALYIGFDCFRGIESPSASPDHHYGSVPEPDVPSTVISSETGEAEALQDLVPGCKHRLLITGAPGAGKTILLLKVVRWYCGRGEVEARSSIPVVFNLSTWNLAEDTKFEDWVVRQLRVKYQIEESKSRNLIENNHLVFVLDGLDEVRAFDASGAQLPPAQAAQRVINLFMNWIRSRPRPTRAQEARYVFACREQTLRALSGPLPEFGGTLHLRPLTREQVLLRLRSERRTRNLHEVLTRNPEIADHAAQNPYLLNVMLKTYGNDSISAEEIEEVLREDFRDELFAEYVKARIASKHSSAYGSARKIHHWLGSVAHLSRAGGEEFLVEEMQPSMITRSRWRKLYSVLYLTVVTAFVLVITAVPAAVGLAVEWAHVNGTAAGVQHGIDVFEVFTAIVVAGTPLAFALGSMSKRFPHSRRGRALIRALNRLGGYWVPLRVAWLNGGMRFAALLSLVLAGMRFAVIRMSWGMQLKGALSNFVFTFLACFATFVWLTGKELVNENMYRVDLDDTRRWDRARMRTGVLTGLAITVILLLAAAVQLVLSTSWEDPRLVVGRAVAFGLTLTVCLPVLFGRTTRVSFASANVRPNHGVWQLVRNGAIAYVVLASVGFFGGWVGYRLFLGPSAGLVNGILALGFGVMALAFGLLGAIRHACLRVVLTSMGELPLRITRLLRYTTDIGLTRTVGGRYMFEHTSLREYFFDQRQHPSP